jgi:hypothetical protein
MSRLIPDIKECDECGCKTDELYLTNTCEVLCADCEADFIIQKSNNEPGRTQ